MAFMMKQILGKFKWILTGGTAVLLVLSGTSGVAADDRHDSVSQPWRAPFLRYSADSWAGPDMLIPRGRDQDRARQGVDSGNYVPLSTILGNIRRQYPGKHLNTRASGAPNSKGLRYEVLWLTPDGRRLDIIADAKSGRIVSVRGK